MHDWNVNESSHCGGERGLGKRLAAHAISTIISALPASVAEREKHGRKPNSDLARRLPSIALRAKTPKLPPRADADPVLRDKSAESPQSMDIHPIGSEEDSRELIRSCRPSVKCDIRT